VTRFSPTEFHPRFENGHLQTLYAWARRRHFPRLPAPEPRYFDVAADARVLAHCHWHPRRAEHPTIILLHGLEGSSHAHYMAGISDKAWAAGWNIVRLNQRNCGGTEKLSRGLYHSGLIGDPVFVMRELIERDGIQAIAVAGYSLGGNLTMKLAGELGPDAPPQLKAVCAVSSVQTSSAATARGGSLWQRDAAAAMNVPAASPGVSETWWKRTLAPPSPRMRTADRPGMKSAFVGAAKCAGWICNVRRIGPRSARMSPPAASPPPTTRIGTRAKGSAAISASAISSRSVSQPVSASHGASAAMASSGDASAAASIAAMRPPGCISSARQRASRLAAAAPRRVRRAVSARG